MKICNKHKQQIRNLLVAKGFGKYINTPPTFKEAMALYADNPAGVILQVALGTCIQVGIDLRLKTDECVVCQIDNRGLVSIAVEASIVTGLNTGFYSLSELEGANIDTESIS